MQAFTRTAAALAFALVATAIASLPAAGQPLTLERLFAEPPIAGTPPASPAWSPDGRQLAFLWARPGETAQQLWLTDRDGSNTRQLSAADKGAVSGFAWIPGSGRLAWLQDGALRIAGSDGSGARERLPAAAGRSRLSVSPDGRHAAWLEGGDLWRVPLANGAAERLTEVGVPGLSSVPVGRYSRPDAEIGPGIWGGPTYAWSPDGKQIAVHYVDRRHLGRVPFPWYLGEETLANEVRRSYPGEPNEARHVGVLDVESGRLELLDLPDPAANQVVGFSWSAGGRLLVDRASDTNVDRWIDIFDPADGSLRRAWHRHRPSRVYTAFSSAWHPDGERVLVASDIEDRYGLYLLEPGSGDYERVTQPGHDLLGEAAVLPRAGAIVYAANDPSPNERHAFRIDADGSRPVRLTFLAGINDAYPSPDGERIAFIHSDDASPPELYLAEAGSDEAIRITESPTAEFRERRPARARYVSFPSRIDDYTLHARILEPPALDPGRRYPVLLGPVYSNTVRKQWSGRWALIQQLLVERGYIVVQVDVRGSTGYGRAFREEFLVDYAGDDIEDLASAVGWLKTEPHVDPARIGIWGSSYGGTLSVFSLLKKPGLFKAAVAAASAVDPRFFGPDDIAIVRTPASHPDIFERTAIRHAANLEDHLLLIHGLQDQVVPFKTTAVLAEELMRHGKDFEFAFAPSATHGWAREPNHARYLFGRMLEHFDRYLEP